MTRSSSQKVGLILGPLAGCAMLFLDLDPGNPSVTRMAAVAVLMATWWITEAIPLSATALVPLVLYPVLGILKTSETAPIYVNSTIFLFVGGFMIAVTMEKWRLHKRIALWIIKRIGGGPARIILGFMVAASFLSMWISNTATAIMMVPIGLAIVLQLEEKFGRAASRPFTTALMLGIAYSCSLGGMATLVGTPPNLSFARIFEISFPTAESIAFGQWLVMALPISLLMVAIAWLTLTRVFYRFPTSFKVDRNVVNREYSALGGMTFEERVVLVVFSITALGWVFRKDLIFGALTLPGWSRLVPNASFIDDATVAVAMAMVLFFIPTRSADADSRMVMGVDVFTHIPWNIVLLFGGGFALAQGFQSTGLSELIGTRFAGLQDVPPLAMITIICGGLTFLTELTSNTATTEMILPILASIAVAMKTSPLLLMIPATLSASCAFMMPVATPPNAIVFGSGRIRIAEMARVGIVLNLVGILVISLVFYFVGTAVLGIETSEFPTWAESESG
ncbi:MAG: SLC13/DASS family transporter [bacterium]|nr:SLC13/DASS family transporter [bacterium]